MFSIIMMVMSMGFAVLLIRSYIKRKRKGDRNLAIVLLILNVFLIISIIVTHMT